MKKKYFVMIMLMIFSMVTFCGGVRAAEITDRQLAIASAYSYMPYFKKNKPIKQSLTGISKLANKVNTKFNLHNYATMDEIGDWVVIDYNGLKSLSQAGLSLVTLVNENNVIIAVEGSFSPVDAYEDIKYGLTNKSSQEKYLKQYVNKILTEFAAKDGEYNFYITGHSLGGYLAQIGGSEIYNLINQNENFSNLNLERVVGFNGMGINFFTSFGKKYNYGNQADTIETLKKINSEGKLIEYYVYGDLVSALGVHYGELREVKPSIDAIAYHRSNYAILKSFGKKLLTNVTKETRLNAFKTDLASAQDYYSVNNIAAYLNLTHEMDHFTTLDVNTSINQPSVKVIKSKSALSSHINSSTKKITISKSTKSLKLKALTSYASARMYEWYRMSNDGSWSPEPVKRIDMYDQGNDIIDNTLDVDVNSIGEGKSAFFKVIAYYDDNYDSKTLDPESTKYEYVDSGKSKISELQTVESPVLEVAYKKSTVTETIKEKISNIFSIFKKKN